MISYCPFCANALPEKLIDGVIFCPKCNRMITSSDENILLSAYRQLLKNKFATHKQFRYDLQISDEHFKIIMNAFDEDLSVQEFQKKLKF